jgi:hypothetical protein
MDILPRISRVRADHAKKNPRASASIRGNERRLRVSPDARIDGMEGRKMKRLFSGTNFSAYNPRVAFHCGGTICGAGVSG